MPTVHGSAHPRPVDVPDARASADGPTDRGGSGRFAPTPSGDLHLGNLRTALLAWLFARSTGRLFSIRVEDLDRARSGSADRQLSDLRAIGLDWDGEVVVQSDRTERYLSAIVALTAAGLTYECFCTRREIQQQIEQAASAAHGPPGAYPGTCRRLTAAELARHRAERPAAVRLRASVQSWTVRDLLHGEVTGPVDDFVLRRGDGVVAYNLAVVVDDAAQGIDQVVRGDDLLPSTPRQAYLAGLLELQVPEYSHVPLAVNGAGQRLAKRDGAVTLTEQVAAGRTPRAVLGLLAHSLRLAAAGETPEPSTLLARFDPTALPREPWVVEL